jgi:hypothetical protein
MNIRLALSAMLILLVGCVDMTPQAPQPAPVPDELLQTDPHKYWELKWKNVQEMVGEATAASIRAGYDPGQAFDTYHRMMCTSFRPQVTDPAVRAEIDAQCLPPKEIVDCKQYRDGVACVKGVQ